MAADQSSRLEILQAIALLQPCDGHGLIKRRLGNPFDGGYVVSDDLAAVSVAYSFGIGPEVSFDRELADAGITVRMFDHTVDGPPFANPRFQFHKVGIGAVDDPASSLLTLESHLRRCGDIGRTDLLLKLDVEGAEFAAIVAAGPGLMRSFRQIVMEIHWLGHLVDPTFRTEFCAAMRCLLKGFHIVHVHGNNCGPISVLEGLPVADVMELTLVRSDLVDPVPSRTVYPTGLDYPNDHTRVDHLLWFYPFLPGLEATAEQVTQPSLAAALQSENDQRAYFHNLHLAALAQATSPDQLSFPPPSVQSAAMDDEAFVRALYLLCLGREVEPSALATFLESAPAMADKRMLLSHLLQSAEYVQAVARGNVLGVDLAGNRVESLQPQTPATPPLDEDALRQLAPKLSHMLLHTSNILGDPNRVKVGEGVQLVNTMFNVASGRVTVHDYVFFGYNVCLLTGTHDHSKFGVDRHHSIPPDGRDIVIGRGAWIATNATVIGPCVIGENAVIAAGSVVTRDVPAGWLAGGVPARLIKAVADQYDGSLAEQV